MVWHLQNIRGSREAVKIKVAAESGVTAGEKTFIASQIDALPGDVTGCKLNAFCQDIDDSDSVTRIVQLTLKGVKL
jgi:hypothetical protein